MQNQKIDWEGTEQDKQNPQKLKELLNKAEVTNPIFLLYMHAKGK